MLTFTRQILRNYQHTGAIAPSSIWLARTMTAPLRHHAGPKRVLEVGPGTGAFTREMLDAAKVGAGYMSIANAGAEADRLVGARSELTPKVELHDMSIKDGMMTMLQVEGGIEVPAGGSVELSELFGKQLACRLRQRLPDEDGARIRVGRADGRHEHREQAKNAVVQPVRGSGPKRPRDHEGGPYHGGADENRGDNGEHRATGA